jgi:TolA-binding protein
MSTELLLAVNGFLTLVLGVSLRALAAIYASKFKTLEIAKEDMQVRVQKIEDVQGSKIDQLTKEFGRMEVKIDEMKNQLITLSQNFHKLKNEESSLVSATYALLKFLERNEKSAS